jgi:N-acetylmuramoyl-L-alanine amidase
MTACVSALAILTAATAIAADTRQLTRIQYWSMGTSTRVAIEFSGEFQFKSAQLDKPERIFFDIPNATFALDGKTKGLYAVAVGDKLVKQVRVANPQAGSTRVVLDLEGEALYTAAVLTNPNRLIVEVYPPGLSPAPSDRPSVSGDVSVLAPAPAAVREPRVLAPMEAAPRIQMESPKKIAAALPSTPAPGPPPTASYASNTAPALAAKATSNGERTLTRALGLKLRRIVIDPGHGGFDEGSSGHHGLKEKDVVLDVALRLGAMLKEKLQTEVHFIRDSDTFVALERRAEIANELHADLFISIHANSSTLRSVNGIETYYLSVDGSKAALEVAARENASSQKSIADLGGLLQQIAMNDRIRESVEFAGKVQSALVSGAGTTESPMRNRGVRRAPFIVLIGAKMPAILAEIGFISNPQEEALLQTPEYRETLAASLFAGIESYAQSLSGIQTASSPQQELQVSGVAAKPAREPVSLKPVQPSTPSAVAVRRGNGPKPSAVRRRRADVAN